MRILIQKCVFFKNKRYLLGWHQFPYDENEDLDEENEEDDDGDVGMEGGDANDDNENNIEENDENDENEDDLPDVNDIISNSQLSETFHNLAKDLDVLDPKDPETDIFKEQLLEDGM